MTIPPRATPIDPRVRLQASYGEAEMALAKTIIFHRRALEAGITDLYGDRVLDFYKTLRSALDALTGEDDGIFESLDPETGEFSQERHDEYQ
jgi:hypothetical protein